ncbi:MAG TPA: inositol monophosphatase family protein [Gemmatimonadales bacterium]|nr:inositol monophosphatase family protein [Gemmatimonadales bacterium]
MASALDLLHLARTAAARAADFLRTVERPADPRAWTAKGRHDFVTGVDRGAEEIIAEVLLAAEPGGRMVGEELSPGELARAGEGLAWIVDPLDGTTNFLHDYPWWAVSIGAAVDGVLEAAVVLNVPRNECFHATRGGGAWLGERRLEVSAITEPGFALVGTGFPFKHLERLDEYQAQFARVMAATSGVRRAGSAALDLADVAAGRFEAFWELHLAPWDIAAGTLLVREAGGRVTDLEGRDAAIAHGPIVAGSPAMHAWLLEVLGSRG